MRLVVILAVVCTLCLAQVETEPHLDESIQRAKETTRISAQNTGFRITARLKLQNLQSGDVEGTYSKLWAPEQRYREELKIGGYVETKIADGGKRWTSRNAGYPPLRIQQLATALQTIEGSFQTPTNQFEFRQRDRKIHGRKAECFEYEGKGLLEQAEFCFDPETGGLVRFVQGYLKVEYSDYQPLGSKLYPRKMRAFHGDFSAFEMDVTEAMAAAITTNDFVLPTGSKEEPPACQEEVSTKHLPLIKKVQPSYPEQSRQAREQGIVAIAVIIDKAGVPQNLQVVGSAGPRLDQAAVEAVSQWRYQPILACGVVREVPATLTVIFQLH